VEVEELGVEKIFIISKVLIKNLSKFYGLVRFHNKKSWNMGKCVQVERQRCF
jgi:hypothetical protein